MKKLKITDLSLHGKQLTIPYDGTVDIPKDGIVEVSDKAYKALKDSRGWQVLDDSDGEDIEDEDEEVEDTGVEGEVEDNEEDEEEDEKIDKKELLKKTVEELKTIADSLGLPKEEWKDLKKAALADYIFKEAYED